MPWSRGLLGTVCPETEALDKDRILSFMPKEKHKQLLKHLVENRGVAIGQAMKEVGYSEAYATNPQQLTSTDSWKKLIEKELPDGLILNKLKEGLEATRIISARVTSKDAGVDTDDFIEVPDYATRHKYVETSLKARGKLGINFDPNDPELVGVVIYKPKKD